jgi:hypothetical protein
MQAKLLGFFFPRLSFFALILTKHGFGLHYGQLFHTVIWSPWSPRSLDEKRNRESGQEEKDGDTERERESLLGMKVSSCNL